MSLSLRSLLTAAICLTAALPAAAQPERLKPADTSRGDTEVIDFVYPGNFAEVLKRAKARNRPFLIKGVAFGVNAEGAECATKGHW